MSIMSDSDTREWEITADGKVWPCCKVLTDLYPQNAYTNSENHTVKDKKFMHYVINDPDWNNAFKKSMSEILNHPLYSEYITQSGWESDTPPHVCLSYCNINLDIDKHSKKHVTKWKVQKN